MKPKRPKGLSAAQIAARKEAKKRELEKAKAAMRKPKPPPRQKGTHYHEPEAPLPSHYAPDAQWFRDGGWSGKR
jgi:hypothetical protein